MLKTTETSRPLLRRLLIESVLLAAMTVRGVVVEIFAPVTALLNLQVPAEFVYGYLILN